MSPAKVEPDSSRAIAVYCGSSIGNRAAFKAAAISLGKAMVGANRPLVYGGGNKGIMGVISATVASGGGHITGVIPSAMVEGGGEGRRDEAITNGRPAELYGRVVIEKQKADNTEVVIVESMHERKVEMAKRASAFIGLPGGFGTFEEEWSIHVLEVITWTQLRIHEKAVLLINVLGFYDPLRMMVESAISSGFIPPQNRGLLLFVDGPKDLSEHETFDWGAAAMKQLETWSLPSWDGYGFKWSSMSTGKDDKNAECPALINEEDKLKMT